MEIFLLTLEQVLMMFLLIAVGFVLRKKKILPENAGTAMAKLETYAFVPGLFLYSQIGKCNVQTLKENYTLILYGLAVVAVSIFYCLSHFPHFRQKKRRIQGTGISEKYL